MSRRQKTLGAAARNSVSGSTDPGSKTPVKTPVKSSGRGTRASTPKVSANPTSIPSKTPEPAPKGPAPAFLQKKPSGEQEPNVGTQKSGPSVVTITSSRRKAYPRGYLTSVKFKIATTEDIIGSSRCQVTDPSVNVTYNSVCDPRMGATYNSDCSSCGKSSGCGGHAGYISLSWPVINPIFIHSVVKIMRLFCFNHYREFNERLQKETIKYKAKLTRETGLKKPDGSQYTTTELGKIVKERLLNDKDVQPEIMPCFDPDSPERDFPNSFGSWRLQLIEHRRGCKKCPGDQEQVSYNVKHEYYIEERIGDKSPENGTAVDPNEIMAFFKAIDEDSTPWARILGFGENKLTSMINVVWPVLSNVQRLDVRVGDMSAPNPLSRTYSQIVAANKLLGDMMEHFKASSDSNTDEDGLKVGSSLTFATIQTLEDPASKSKGADVYKNLCASIKKLLLDKEESDPPAGQYRDTRVASITLMVNGKPGVIRKDVMGKGGDFGGNTVIIGDNNIDVDEIGISRLFADTLTIPEILKDEADVSKWTAEMPKIVGDTKVMGNIVKVKQLGKERSTHIKPDSSIILKIGDIVRRKLVNGDVVNVSRQPILHKGGYMGFYVRIFESGGNVLRLHPSVAGPFNADFDGDTMNFSIPQDAEARADVLNHMMVGHCIRGDGYSSPWVGMIQNPVVAALEITKPGVIIERNLAKRLIQIGLDGFRRRNPGNIFRTDTKDYYDDLHSLNLGIDPSGGHALVSFFMPKNFKYERQVKGGDPIVVERGYMLSGTLTKADVGKASDGLVDTILATYGSEAVIVFISTLNRALYEFISSNGFTIGIRDCVLPNLPDGTNPQDNIDNLARDTSKQVVELMERSKKVGYLGHQAELQADKLLSELSDRINAIVVAGGVDVIALQAKLNMERSDDAFVEALEFSLTLPVELDVNEASTANLLEAGILENNDTSLHKLITKMLNIIKQGRRSGDKNAQYNEEMHVLRILTNRFENADPIDYAFEDLSLASYQPTDVNNVIATKFRNASNLRGDIIGASKFNNRLLTTVYSGAKGTTSNVLQALGAVGAQEKEFINQDETMQRALPMQKQGETDPMLTHYCSSSYAKGLDELEFWEHASASRANIITSKLKPSDTGWFYRRAVVIMMDIFGLVDGTARDERGRIVEFMYGGDGFDATKIINVNKSVGPEFINIVNAAKHIRTRDGLAEFEFK